jgi:hypothetical protein
LCTFIINLKEGTKRKVIGTRELNFDPTENAILMGVYFMTKARFQFLYTLGPLNVSYGRNGFIKSAPGVLLFARSGAGFVSHEAPPVLQRRGARRGQATEGCRVPRKAEAEEAGGHGRGQSGANVTITVFGASCRRFSVKNGRFHLKTKVRVVVFLHKWLLTSIFPPIFPGENIF